MIIDYRIIDICKMCLCQILVVHVFCNVNQDGGQLQTTYLFQRDFEILYFEFIPRGPVRAYPCSSSVLPEEES